MNVDRWDFDKGPDGWRAGQDCTLSVAAGVLSIRSTGIDPQILRVVQAETGPLLITLRARSKDNGDWRVFWTTRQSPQRSERQAAGFSLKTDGRWHEVSVRCDTRGKLRDLRIDPGNQPGSVDIDWIRLDRTVLHPLSIEVREVLDRQVCFDVINHGAEPIEFSVFKKKHRLDGQQSLTLRERLPSEKPLDMLTIDVRCGGLPPLCRRVFAVNPNAKGDWIVRPLNAPDAQNVGRIEIAADGSMAKLYRGKRLAAAIGPLVLLESRPVALKQKENTDGAVCFEGQGVVLRVRPNGCEVDFSIQSEKECEGPIVRAMGVLEQGLFAGQEYLGKGERSSSKLDIETKAHVRFMPPPIQITMPLAAFSTDRGLLAMTWKDMRLQPTFATPNFVDMAPDHRMSLRGKRIEATLWMGHGTVEEAIHWCVKKRGLPPLPKPPRTVDEQWTLCRKALGGPLKTKDGWGHCAGERWGRQPFADMASTVWRLDGKAPELKKLVPNGAHVRNDAIYFVTGRAKKWLAFRRQQAERIIKRQQPSGAFRYKGKYLKGHFEDTASGFCAMQAAKLLEFARLTGDKKALDAGILAIDYMKRFRTPRGAQVWELSLHTPDQLASAYLVHAYTRGFELTGNRQYLKEARRWALSGVPFVYLWQCHPIMLYAAPPVFGATNWVARSSSARPNSW
ncbi:MAG: hypothetical protein U9N87_06575, partial [Planctomycetota bacterium]|nr:hypothetical protein [Planctomycetota bacterium]